MPVSLRRTIRNDKPVIEHASSKPRVYLDTWALQSISINYRDRFVEALNVKKGSLCLSFFNLVELAHYRNKDKKARIFELIDTVDSVLIDVDPDRVIASKTWYDMDFAKEIEKEMNPLEIFGVTSIIKHIDNYVEQTGQRILESFEKNLYPKVQQARKNKDVVKVSKLRLMKKNYVIKNDKPEVKVKAVLDACFDFIVLKDQMRMDDGEWRDTFHTVVPVCCCDFVLIDGRWTRFLVESGLSYPQIAKVFNSKQTEDFLNELEQFKASSSS